MRRKGELSQAEINRRWPHHVAIPQLADHGLQYRRNVDIGHWMNEAGEQACERSYSIVHGDEWWEVRCFASSDTAARFIEKFGGKRLDPKAKPRGPGWQGKGDFKPG